MPPATDLTGADAYMTGLTQFAQGVVPGGAASMLAAPVLSGRAARIAATAGMAEFARTSHGFSARDRVIRAPAIPAGTAGARSGGSRCCRSE